MTREAEVRWWVYKQGTARGAAANRSWGGPGAGFLPEFGRNGPCPPLDFELLVSRTARLHFCHCRPPLAVFRYGSHRELTVTLKHGPATRTPALASQSRGHPHGPGGTTAQEGQRRGPRASSIWGPPLRSLSLALQDGRPCCSAPYQQPLGNDSHYVIVVSLGSVICHC